ncbi:carbohydrate kinase [Brevibacillus fluminis]|uniref:Carbohydrate kinase n=1 Tax=Brevibacillus fluminis TaxID=511487 RepID=A0A3M8DCY4_9BACL|nr:carbohydrate kinase [Brevibacillus fluminis]RNB85858.1 carbohydrate kinase [Brevibacillus fluminis]
MSEVVALGELLIDFTPAGKSEKGNQLFETNPGGAPANVLAAVARLGGKTGFIGKVGADQFGHFLQEVLQGLGIDTSGLLVTNEAQTTLAFVHLTADGDRSFSFYRDPGADVLLCADELRAEWFGHTRFFHFSSNSLTAEPARSATHKAIQLAKAQKALISFDPNIRLPLWKEPHRIKEQIEACLPHVDFLKVSREELEFVTGCSDLSEGTLWLHDKFGIRVIFVTLGVEGCYFRVGEQTGMQAGYTVKTVDTTGAGDAFCGAVLYRLLQISDPAACEVEQLAEIVDFANAAGALSTAKMGAIPAMPTFAQIEQLRKTVTSP